MTPVVPEPMRVQLAELGVEIESAGGLLVGAADPRSLALGQVIWQAGATLRAAVDALAIAQVLTGADRAETQTLVGRVLEELAARAVEAYDTAGAELAAVKRPGGSGR